MTKIRTQIFGGFNNMDGFDAVFNIIVFVIIIYIISRVFNHLRVLKNGIDELNKKIDDKFSNEDDKKND